jgi:hypothetical protein
MMAPNSVRTEFIRASSLTQEPPAKILLRFVRIVRATPQLQVVRRRRATIRKRDHMVELEKAAFNAATLNPYEGALPSVARPHFAPEGGGHMTGPMSC